MRTPFPAKTPAEIKLITFDFSAEVPEAATLSTPVVTSTLVKGSGANVDVDGGSLAVDDKRVSVLVGAGVDGATYRLSCIVDVSNGEHSQIDRDLPISAKAAIV